MDRHEEVQLTAKMKLFNSAVLGLAGIGLLFNLGFGNSGDGRDPLPAAEASSVKSDIPPAPASLPEKAAPKNVLFEQPAWVSRLPAVAARPEILPKAAVAERTPAVIVAYVSVEEVPIERRLLSELELAKQLGSVPTIGFEDEQAYRALLESLPTTEPPNEEKGQRNFPEDVVLAVLDEADYSSLPFQENQNCRLTGDEAAALDEYAELMHEQIDLIDRSLERRFRHSAAKRRDSTLAYAIKNGRKWRSEKAVPAMMQILQVEPERLRRQLVDTVSKSPSEEAIGVLVNRAVYDLSPSVRAEANAALKNRSSDAYRDVLIKAFRYPWSEAAWNAAETLVAVNDQEAVPRLIDLLDAPDPAKPYREESGKVVVRELVRLNHVKNCLLCHARTAQENDPVTGFVPPPGSQAYYESRSSGILVRADVTYLRQDFSALNETYDLNIANSQPRLERYDYLVRTRELTSEEIAAMEIVPPENTQAYPQREAVLFALQKLTGQNLGRESEDWRRLFAEQFATK